MWLEFKLTYREWNIDLDCDADKLPPGTLVIGIDGMNAGYFNIVTPQWGYKWEAWQPIRLTLDDLKGRGFGHDRIIESLFLTDEGPKDMDVDHIAEILKKGGKCYVKATFDMKLKLPIFPLNERTIISLIPVENETTVT